MLMFDKILDFIEAGPLRRSVKYRTRTRVKFSNGSWIIALPSGRYGHTLRGHTAHLIILDEAAFIPIEVIENVVFPMLATTNGDCWMLSTPWGTDHTFYRAWNSPDWSKHHWPTSVNLLVSPQFLEEQKGLIGEERFRIEYLAEFRERGGQLLPNFASPLMCRRLHTYAWSRALSGAMTLGGKDSYGGNRGCEMGW
jgi:hypothetical protein